MVWRDLRSRHAWPCDFGKKQPGFSGNKKAGVAEPMFPIISNPGFCFRHHGSMAFDGLFAIGGILPQPWGLSRGIWSYLKG